MTRPANNQLATVMEQAGISNKGLAALVRAEAFRRHLDISPNHVSVRRWLDGTMPRDDTAACVAAVIGVRVGRPIEPADLGFESAADASELSMVEIPRYSMDSVDPVLLLDRLTSADLHGHPVVERLEWSEVATPQIITGYLFARPEISLPETLVIESNPAIRIRATVRTISNLDFQFGGGHTREMLLYFWKREIIPLLRREHPQAVRRDVFAAAADAAEVLGWSAYDSGKHGAAQRYFAYGLSLAQEAGDRLMGGQILSNLSHQANYLGRFGEAAQLARAAQTAVNKVGQSSATVDSMFLAMEARALANLGEAQECAKVLHKAQRVFERRNLEHDPDWIGYFDELELAGEAAHCFRDLGQSRETQKYAALAIDDALTPPRTRAFIAMVNAAGALQGGNLDEAIHLATSSLTLADSLNSHRYLRYVNDFHLSLTAHHGRHASTIAFGELLRAAKSTSERLPA